MRGNPATPHLGAHGRVYPRACGGTGHSDPISPPVQGLSPRMRGNLGRLDIRPCPHGSIPAHAGEPPFLHGDSPFYGVYPRACGGTIAPMRVLQDQQGLSPRMRGNRRCLPADGAQEGSIPAHAGEPRYDAEYATEEWVYPRACGGTFGWPYCKVYDEGLSPRMRGNPRVCRHSPEPQWVYPRACGGTVPGDRIIESSAGLSPRMRGNRRHHVRRNWCRGSIPAHAGEPVQLAFAPSS